MRRRFLPTSVTGYSIRISRATPSDIPDPPAYVDINNDGTVIHDDPFPPKATAANGRLFGLATDHWTLASVTHKVNVNDFFGIGAVRLWRLHD